MERNARNRELTALEQSLMEENDRLAAENAEHRKASGDSMEVKTGLGSLKASGSVVVIVLAIAAGAAFTAYMIRDHDLRNVDRAAEIRASQREIVTGQKQVVESLDSNTFVLTLSESERRALRLDMPESLRRKANSR